MTELADGAAHQHTMLFFEPGKLLLVFEPKPQTRAKRGGTPVADQLPRLEQSLGDFLRAKQLAVKVLGEPHQLRRTGAPRLIQSVEVTPLVTTDRPGTPRDPRLDGIVAVRDALAVLNPGPLVPTDRKRLESGDYQLSSASPNWYAAPFQI